MTDTLIVAVCIVAAMFIMIPRSIWRYLAGYVVPVDILASVYAVNTGVATGTVSGMTAGFVAAILISLALRLMRYRHGSVQLALNGDTGWSVIIAGLFTQAVAWVRALVKALFAGGRVAAPEPLAWSWVEDRRSHSWAEGLQDIKAALMSLDLNAKPQ